MWTKMATATWDVEAFVCNVTDARFPTYWSDWPVPRGRRTPESLAPYTFREFLQPLAEYLERYAVPRRASSSSLTSCAFSSVIENVAIVHIAMPEAAQGTNASKKRIRVIVLSV
jgi:hypothetical protein